MRQYLILIFCFLVASESFSQEDESDFNKLVVSVHVGTNTTSTNSSYASLLGYNWSVGVSRNFRTKRESFEHRLKFKVQAFNESLKKLPYYSLDASNNLVASTYTNRGMYSMLYLGWGANYVLPTKKKALSIRGDVGFNFLLPVRFTSVYSNGAPKGVQTYRRPNNYFFTRPEVSVGLGYKIRLGQKEMILSPFYSYNFTINYLNLVPTFHTAGVEVIFNL